MVVYIIVGVIAYLIGSISSSVIISKKLAGFDVREKGSGNAGSTNVLRSVGKKAAAITLVCDILKGVIAILIAFLVGKFGKELDKVLLIGIAEICVVIGHTFPVFFGFKGGKGVATSLGILMIVNWKIGLICLLFAIMLMALTRMVSLGSICAAVLFFVLSIFIHDSYIVEYSPLFIIFAGILAFIVVFNHRSNLKRIIAGNENKLSFSKSENNQKEKSTGENLKEEENEGEKQSEEIKNEVNEIDVENKEENLDKEIEEK